MTEITVKLTRNPEAVKTLLAIFDSVDDATETVAEITARGITPAACEMLDGWTHSRRGRLRSRRISARLRGDPADRGRRPTRSRPKAMRKVLAEVCCFASRARGARGPGRAGARPAVEGPQERVRRGWPPVAQLLHARRRDSAHEASAKRCAASRRSARNTIFSIGNVFHAGDGNLHPIILFDQRNEQEFRDTIRAGDEILEFCIAMGGSITGEHGVGMEKDRLMPLLFTEADLALMRRVRAVFNPDRPAEPRQDFSTLERLRRNLRASPPGRVDAFRMSAAGSIALSQLAEISGEANVIRDPAHLAAYQIDGRYPVAAVQPGSERGSSRNPEIRRARKAGAGGFPGARTKLAMGMPPRQYDLALDMTRMNRDNRLRPAAI